MRQTTQDTTARRFSPEFDCELPQAALDELMQLRQFVENEGHVHLAPTQQVNHAPHQAEIALQRGYAPIHVKPPEPPRKMSPVSVERPRWRPALGWILAVAALAAFWIALAVSWPRPQTREKALRESAQASRSAEEKATAAMEALRSSKPSVQPTPAQPVSQPPVDQTRLVQKPAPKAILLRLPWQELGVYKWYELPDVWGGGAVWARYLGTVERFSQIPPNPVPGDLWNVTETGASWIYCFPVGYDHAVWVDP